MKGTWSKRIAAVVLSLAVLVTLFPEAAITANAAGKKVTATKKITITEGMKQAISVKNLPKSATVKWKSSDPDIVKVSKKGIVAGVVDGTTTVRGTYKVSGKTSTIRTKVKVKTPAIKNAEYIVTSGSSITVSLKNKYKKSKYTWTSSDTAVATVDNKGLVTGVSSGSAIISVKISIPKSGLRKAKTIKRAVTITVQGSHVVATQAELDAALKKNTYTGITIRTDEKVNLNIPAGDYKSTDLIVDAPNADITNYGDFKSITIKQIATDTFVERAKNNVLIVDAAAGRVRIPVDAGVDEIKIINPNSNFLIEIEGNIETVTVDSASTVRLNVTGFVDHVNVNGKSNITFEGSSAKNIQVNVASTADGTTVNSSVKLDITSGANTEINLARGAEGSSVKTTNTAKSVEVTNNTTSSVTVSNDAGKNQTVSPSKNATINGAGEVTGTTTPDTTSGGSDSDNTNGNSGSGASSTGGNSGTGSYDNGSTSGGTPGGNSSESGGAQPSGDLTRTVTSFESIKAVDAGIAGTPLKSVETLITLFPNNVTGISTSGDVIFSVKSWENTDNYDPTTAKAGYYTFTAVLGDGDIPNTIKSGVTATVEVWVKPTKGSIAYDNTYNTELKKFTFDGEEKLTNGLVIKLKFNGTDYVSLSSRINYYNKAGKLVKTDSRNQDFFQNNDIQSLLYSAPEESDYEAYTITLSVHKVDYYVSAKNSISLGKPSSATDVHTSDGFVSCKFILPITNNSITEVTGGLLLVYYLHDGTIIDADTENIGGIVGNGTTNKEILYYRNSTTVVPDQIIVECNNAYVATTQTTQETVDDHSIIYDDTSNIDYNKFTYEDEEKIADKLIVKLKYSGDQYASVESRLNFYNASGELIKTDNRYGDFFQEGDTLGLLYNLPKDSSGNLISYSAYTIGISAHGADYYKSMKDNLSFGDASSATDIISTDDYSSCSFRIPITNNGNAEVTAVQLVAYYLKDGKVIDIRNESIYNIAGNGTSYEDIQYYTKGSKNSVVIPDQVKIKCNYAYIGTNQSSQTIENRAISYSYSDDESVEKFTVDTDRTIDDKIVVSIKYVGQDLVMVDGEINFYNQAGDLIKTESRDYDFYQKDDIQEKVFNLPKNSEGEVIPYAAYTIDLSVHRPNDYQSAKNSISLGVPTLKNDYSTDDCINCTYILPITNSGTAEINAGRFIVYYLKDGKVIDVEEDTAFNLTGGTTTNHEISYFKKKSGNNDVVPNGIEVKCNNAYISTRQ